MPLNHTTARCPIVWQLLDGSTGMRYPREIGRRAASLAHTPRYLRKTISALGKALCSLVSIRQAYILCVLLRLSAHCFRTGMGGLPHIPKSAKDVPPQRHTSIERVLLSKERRLSCSQTHTKVRRYLELYCCTDARQGRLGYLFCSGSLSLALRRLKLLLFKGQFIGANVA